MPSDLDRLATALAPVQAHARGLRWARERPWRTDTHLWREGPLPVVDLHDLDAKTCKQALDGIVAVGAALDAGAVVLITGVGKHRPGGGALGQIVTGRLGMQADERGWQLAPKGRGRFVLIIDPARAPASATGRLGPLFWLGAIAFAAAALAALWLQLTGR
ncbi:MAG: hypothetical protein H6742_09860 [Alphaproteobacteria bacterium]|nr:hypothetical protein [Alphaproteobacteria bacterium]